MEILSIIPARGGSKGIKRKNLKEILNKPLVAYSIEDKSYFDKSSLIKNLYIVGGAQKVVMLYFLNIGKISSEWNLSKS